MKIIFLFFLGWIAHPLYAQQKLIATVPIESVQSAYIDRPGDLYILQKDNSLKKFDIHGKLVSEDVFTKTPTVFDPRDGSRSFLYNHKTQQFSFFSQETRQDFSVEQQYAIDPVLVCSSGDYQIWILDGADWSLKRVNPSLSKVITEASIDQKQFSHPPEFTFLREYQNFLFVVEKKTGILVFNSLGKQIKKIAVPEIEYLNFIGEELYYKKGNTLFFYDLFDATERQITVDAACKFVLLTDTRTFLIYDNRVDFMENK